MAEEYTCNSCGTKIQADDTEDLLGKGWHVVKSGGEEKILCPDCFRRGRASLPGEGD